MTAAPRPVLLVTGGSRGIGAATCRLAAAQGYDLAINYRSEEAAAEALAAECRGHGVQAIAVRGDVSDEADIERVFTRVDHELGRLTHLVNNAGITGRASRLDDAPPDDVRRVIDLNVTGAILVAREAIRRMSPRHGGSGGAIVNLSSAAVWLGAPNDFVWYAASKGAIDSLTIGLSKELGAENIRVNAVAPGLIETDIHETAGLGGRIERLAPMVPMQRGGTAEEVARVILFLLSQDAAYVTGAVYRVTGGR
ncbi:SDR family oxidoreductase [Alsobacter sp. SYSU M60028]|uniref:SDR family oxidoreductase n=1 Tax=Alsobacter ponti TaxID=2962936 RepID=A0ABT1L926_9HYPH|nr:SDR family oxidoreductase [Alsobacter ponti]MCP8937992.1 SDR family oxidoreductase [Alsobacter ponti]